MKVFPEGVREPTVTLCTYAISTVVDEIVSASSSMANRQRRGSYVICNTKESLEMLGFAADIQNVEICAEKKLMVVAVYVLLSLQGSSG